MIELAQHIETLLLENDCVIVPSLGGFVAHYLPARRVAEEHLFLPPTRTIGFNPQLTMNDGLLIQSVMSADDTNYADAVRRVEAAVNNLIITLHEEGKAELRNVGELRYSIRGSYSFQPYDHKLTTPYLYGLDSFEIKELTAQPRHLPQPVPATVHTRSVSRRQVRRTTMPIQLSHIAAVAAMVLVVLGSFFFSTPVENTEVIRGNYAHLMPAELFSQIEKYSLVATPIATAQPRKEKKPATNPVAVKEIKVKEVKVAPAGKPAPAKKSASVEKPAPKVAAKHYHIIVSSVGSERDAEAMTTRLIKQGYSDARPIIGGGKCRVSIASFTTHAEATEALKQVRQTPAYQTAWVLKQ